MRPAARQMLDQLIALEEADDPENYPAEIMLDGLWAHIALARYHRQSFNDLIMHCAVSQIDDQIFIINATGRAIQARPEFSYDVARALAAGKPFIIQDGKIDLL